MRVLFPPGTALIARSPRRIASSLWLTLDNREIGKSYGITLYGIFAPLSPVGGSAAPPFERPRLHG